MATNSVKRVRKFALRDLLVQRGLFADQVVAASWVMGGNVLVNGQRVDKPGTAVPEDAELRVRGRQPYASRGGFKLAAALDHFGVSVEGRVALDSGASTGGFTDCLLQRGASLVYAVEVGHGQLVGRLRVDPRVHNLERTNFGDNALRGLSPPPTLVTLDLSYLSLVQALPIASTLLDGGGEVTALFKPLFEVDDAEVRRTGAIKDQGLVVRALERVLDAGVDSALKPVGLAKLALRPRNGVSEFVLHFVRNTMRPAMHSDRASLDAVVRGPGIGPDTDE